jgi:hypothetical protein
VFPILYLYRKTVNRISTAAIITSMKMIEYIIKNFELLAIGPFGFKTSTLEQPLSRISEPKSRSKDLNFDTFLTS